MGFSNSSGTLGASSSNVFRSTSRKSISDTFYSTDAAVTAAQVAIAPALPDCLDSTAAPPEVGSGYGVNFAGTNTVAEAAIITNHNDGVDLVARLILKPSKATGTNCPTVVYKTILRGGQDSVDFDEGCICAVDILPLCIVGEDTPFPSTATGYTGADFWAYAVANPFNDGIAYVSLDLLTKV